MARRRATRLLSALLLLAPALALLGIVFAYPIVRLVELSTQDVITYERTLGVGLDNYRFLWDDPEFRRSLANSGRLLLAVPLLLGLSVLVAAGLRERLRGWRLQSGLIVLLYVLPIPAFALALRQILRGDGLFNQTLETAGLSFLAEEWLASASLAIWTVLAIIVIKELGLGVLIFSARLNRVDDDLYEAARMDGARWWRQLWHVTLPQTRDVMGFYVVIAAVTIVSWVFAYVYVLTGGGPANSTSILEIYLYRRMFGVASGGQDIGTAAAVGVLMLVAIVAAFALAAAARYVVLTVRRRRAVAR
ncbi:MAG TPA: sugar ABC transporter permease [Thermoleophilaceae bacterium]|nr:sugar ABC transporter permease [Thermoleophilaceae bacterium]